MHPLIHLELARIRHQELISKAKRSRAALARLNRDRQGEPGLRHHGTLEPTLHRRPSTLPFDARR